MKILRPFTGCHFILFVVIVFIYTLFLSSFSLTVSDSCWSWFSPFIMCVLGLNSGHQTPFFFSLWSNSLENVISGYSDIFCTGGLLVHNYHVWTSQTANSWKTISTAIAWKSHRPGVWSTEEKERTDLLKTHSFNPVSSRPLSMVSSSLFFLFSTAIGSFLFINEIVFWDIINFYFKSNSRN